MSSTDKEHTLNINIQMSLQKILLIGIPHLLAIIIIIYSVVTLGINTIFLILLFGVLVSSIYFFRLHVKLDLKKSIHNLHRDQKGNWSINTPALHHNEQVMISGKSFACDLFIILCVIDKTKNQSIVLITKDSVTEDHYRKVRVFINTQKFSC